MVTDRRQRECAAQHFGAWMVKPAWLSGMVGEYRAGRLRPAAQAEPNARDAVDPADDFGQSYRIANGVAVIDAYGQMTKYKSSFGGASYIGMKHALRHARTQSPARAAMIALDTPGGTVAGFAEFRDEIMKARDAGFSVYAFADDHCCSGGYRIAVACDRIYANPGGMVGCIGTYSVLTDYTGEREQLGLRDFLVSSGGVKGLGADGKVTQELLDDVAREITELNTPFVAEVQAGRGFTDAQAEAIADGRAHIATRALELGLVDQLASIDEAFTDIVERTEKMNRDQFLAHARENHADLQAAYADVFPEQAATIQEIEAACPGCDSAFALDQLKAGSTLEAARAAWADTLAARLESRDSEIEQLNTAHTEAIKSKDDEIDQLKTDIANVKLGLSEQEAAGAADAEAKATPARIVGHGLTPGQRQLAESIQIPENN